MPSDFNTVSVLCSVMWVAGWRVNISTGCNYYYYYDSVVGGKQQEREPRGPKGTRDLLLFSASVDGVELFWATLDKL